MRNFYKYFSRVSAIIIGIVMVVLLVKNFSEIKNDIKTENTTNDDSNFRSTKEEFFEVPESDIVSVKCTCKVPEGFKGNISCKFVNMRTDEDSYFQELKKDNDYTTTFKCYKTTYYAECKIDNSDEYNIIYPKRITTDNSDKKDNIFEVTLEKKNDTSVKMEEKMPKDILISNLKSNWFSLVILVVLMVLLFICERKNNPYDSDK